MSEKIINGIDVSECVFFRERYTRIGDDVDNDISFENHCMLSECTFNICNCEKINCHFKQLKRLQKENNELKKLKCKFKEYCTCNIEKYRSALEEIRKIVEPIKENTCFGMNCGAVNWILNEIDEVLNDRD